jgi:NAD(P)-dependent dehydrogenase (short-subunit alcohol dehydrogenase family)
VRLLGKRVLITGAGSGIGEATAILFAREGASVGLIGRRRAPLESVAARIAGEGGISLTVPADVSKERDIEDAVGTVVDAWGGLDVCVAVAGIEPGNEGDASVDRLDLEVWNEVIAINLTGMFLTCKHTIRAMLQGGRGSLIVTGSPTGMYGFALGQHAYAASKAGCHGLARVMANEYGRQGIRVNCVIPGFIDTPINHRFMQDQTAVDRLTETIPMRRPGHAEEIAAMNLWLASDEASYATGGYFVVDGGHTAV